MTIASNPAVIHYKNILSYTYRLRIGKKLLSRTEKKIKMSFKVAGKMNINQTFENCHEERHADDLRHPYI